MELIVINENKLKIMMNKDEMRVFGLDENEFYCSVTNAREILDKILHSSPVKTGFEGLDKYDKLLIQLYPEINGGCELYVTKISFEENEEANFMSEENESRYLLPKHIPKKMTLKTPLVSYRFENLEHSISAAKELSQRGFYGESAFYQNHDGKYYLFVSTKSSQGDDMKAQTEFLSEFGENTNAENSFLLLSEYGKCIFKQNSIEQLAKL